MNYYEEEISSASKWLADTVRSNPEALLVLAAGAVLLMRGSRAERSRSTGRSSGAAYAADRYRPEDAWEPEMELDEREPGLGEQVTGGAREAGRYASEMAGRMYESTSAYAAAATDYAERGAEELARRAYRLSGQARGALEDRPLAIAALGLAAGAGLAALLPSTRIERRAFVPARQSLTGAATATAEHFVRAAADAGRRLQREAAARGLSADGLREMARDAERAFRESLSDEAEEPGGSQGKTGGARARQGSQASGPGGGGNASTAAPSRGSGSQTGGATGGRPAPTGGGRSGSGAAGAGQGSRGGGTSSPAGKTADPVTAPDVGGSQASGQPKSGGAGQGGSANTGSARSGTAGAGGKPSGSPGSGDGR